MAGRGTDIQLGGNVDIIFNKRLNGSETKEEKSTLKEQIKKEVSENKEKVMNAGGLYILGTERHESRRIDNQLRGRSGRQGDKGNSKFFLSLEDDLMRIFGSERMSEVLHRLGLPEGEALVHPFISKALEKAQQKVEERNFDIRKSLLKYDDVMNEQRKVIYAQRKEIMFSDNVNEMILDMRQDYIYNIINTHISLGTPVEEWNIAQLKTDINNTLGFDIDIQSWAKRPQIDYNDMVELILTNIETLLKEKNKNVPTEIINIVEKSIVLQTLDQLWKDHIAALDIMRYTIVLRAYGQKDPLNEYKRESFNMFSEMLDVLKERITIVICRTQIQNNSDEEMKALEEEKKNQKIKTIHNNIDNGLGGQANSSTQDIQKYTNVSRNSACPCGSGKKYKHCHGKIA